MRRDERLRGRVLLSQEADWGFGLAEVLVAMFIFAIVSVGVLQSLVSVLSVNRDARGRQVAANLAAAEIDRAREVKDVFQLLPGSFTTQVGTDTYQVTRDAQWVSDPNADFQCGSGGSALRYKRVNVTVTWDNMRRGTEPVRSDTVIEPKDRINDPSKSTLLVSVLNSQGLGTADVTVTAQPIKPDGTNIGAPLPNAKTDTQGCAYILKAPPGDYRISIAKADHVNTQQQANPSTIVGVEAGNAASVAFEYDRAATYRVTYKPAGANGTVRYPTRAPSMSTTFVSTAGYSTIAGPWSPTQSFKLYPFTAGYGLFAGTDVKSEAPEPTCKSVDPANWANGVRTQSAAAPPGGTVDVEVPLAVINIDTSTGSGDYIRARTTTPLPGSDDPGCFAGQEYTFESVLSSGKASIALPYGTWQIFRGNSRAQNTLIQTIELDPRLP